jgi:hypothetical protein
MYDSDADVLLPQVWVIGQDAAGEIVECSGELDPRETAARDDECKQSLPRSFVCFLVGELKHVDDVIPNADGVQETLEIKR